MILFTYIFFFFAEVTYFETKFFRYTTYNIT
jgi:hypothetical protein